MFYLYFLKGSFDQDGELIEERTSIYNEVIAKVEEYALMGSIYDVYSHISQALS